jgi:hypothetical protein
MSDWDEDPFTPTDEIEDPIIPSDDSDEENYYEPVKLTKKEQEIQTQIRHLFQTLCKDTESGKFPMFQNWNLIRKTRNPEPREWESLALKWIKCLKKERAYQNTGAIYYTKFLMTLPDIMLGNLPEETEEWASQIRTWRS